MTYRVMINLPDNHMHVVRVKPDIILADLFQMAVAHRSLDPNRYELRHPTQPEKVLDLTAPLSRYGVTEVSVVEMTGRTSSRRQSAPVVSRTNVHTDCGELAGKTLSMCYI